MKPWSAPRGAQRWTTLAPSPAERTAVALAVALFVVTAGLPIVALASRVDASGLSLLAAPRPWSLMARSIALASAVTAGSAALGVPLGAVFARGRIPLRRTAFALHLLPIFLPPFFAGLGWFHVFGAAGVLGSEATASLLFGPVGACGVLVGAFSPVFTALTFLGIQALDPSLEEAGRVVASPVRVLARILVPAARAPIALAAIIVFALAFGELGVPMFLRVDVYPAAVFARLGGMAYAPAEAAALSLPIVAVAAILATFGWRVLDASRAGLSISWRASPDRLELGPAASTIVIAGEVASILPVGSLVVRGVPSLPAAASWVGASVQNGLLASGAAACVALPAAIVLGHAALRGRRAAQMTDATLLFAFFVPSAVLGVGLTTVWNRPVTHAIYASPAILVLGFVARYAVLAVNGFAASCAHSSVSYEETAATLGAGYARRLLRIVVPMNRRGALAAFALVLVFSLRDLETAVLFYPPGGEPLTVRIFTLEANGPPAVVAALATIHIAVTSTVLIAVAWVGGRGAR